MSHADRHVLVARLDSMGDMLICGPAIRAVAAGARRVSVLAGPRGAQAARLLPGVDEVVVFDAPWIASPAPPVSNLQLQALTSRVAALAPDAALVLTSFHQNALPTALLLRMAGVPWIAGISTDYPGSLLDVRLAEPAEAPEPRRMAEVARSAGWPLPPGDDGRPAVDRRRLPAAPPVPGLPDSYVVVHPGADAPARSYPARSWAAVVDLLTAAGQPVLVTGGQKERALTAAGGRAPGRGPRRPAGPAGPGRGAGRGRRRGRGQHRAGAPGGRRRHPGGQPLRPGRAAHPVGALRAGLGGPG